MRVRKKPVVIEAMHLTDANWRAIYDWIGEDAGEWCWDKDEKFIVIETLEGNMKANEGDWIIKGIEGEFYPCKPAIFEKTYEVISE